MKPIVELSQVLQDSPKFRETLEQNEKNIDQLETKLDKLLKLCNTMIDAGKLFLTAKQNFIGGMKDVSGHFKDDPIVSDPLNKLVHALSELENYNSILLDQAQRSVVKNISNFIKNDIKSVKETKRFFEKISDDLDTSLQRNSQSPRSKPQESEEIQNVLCAFRSCFRHTALDYICQISCLQSRKRFEVLDTFLSLMRAYSTFFHQGSDLFLDLDSHMKQVAGDVAHLQEDTAELTRELDGRHNIVTSKDIVPYLTKASEGGPGVRMEGYLFKRTSNAFKTWNRRWFIIQKSQLVYRKRTQDELTVMEEDLRLCTVKPVYEVDRRFCFEVVSPNKNHVLQADSEETYQQWISAFQEAIKAALNHVMRDDYNQENSQYSLVNANSTESLTSNQSTSSGASDHKLTSIISHILSKPGNDACCDCKNTDPSWASINLGITLCIECSGIHRGLGVHISKVRSLTLDAWEPELLKVMLELGNDLANQIYEARYHESNVIRATTNSTRAEREVWIRSKYVEKLFIHPKLSIGFEADVFPVEFPPLHPENPPPPPPPDLLPIATQDEAEETEVTTPVIEEQCPYRRQGLILNSGDFVPPSPNLDISCTTPTNPPDQTSLDLNLYQATKDQNLQLMFTLMAFGADPNWKNPEDNYRNILHQSVMTGSMTITEFLMLNNTKCNVQDEEELKTPLHLATELGHTGLVCLLLKRGANQHLRDKDGKDALEAAITTTNADIVTLLRLSKLNEEMRKDEFGSPGDDTFNEVVKDFSHMASHFPEKLQRRLEQN